MSHNNSYGNYAGTYQDQCLPNIVFAIGRIPSDDGLSCSYGDQTWQGGWDDYDGGGGTGHRGCTWYASRYNSIYKDNCKTSFQTNSFIIYMWIRTA